MVGGCPIPRSSRRLLIKGAGAPSFLLRLTIQVEIAGASELSEHSKLSSLKKKKKFLEDKSFC
jgi:hypothetical protein